jgi:hypothetical protein
MVSVSKLFKDTVKMLTQLVFQKRNEKYNSIYIMFNPL